ncbi:hypothetical protein RND71_028020 [Anisodus tanguticus]|uniref:Uncharacterized protein n=1 Tax=Anisodus tanguticus TaxID=243964 RepID=A0AAE1RKS1_9SOLA|nr:hypothetical protein RND71_028020 [Anisodus tanguticus]
MQSRKGEEKQEKSVMEKSRSYPQYSSSNYSGEFGNFQDDQVNAYTFNGPTTKGFGPLNDPELKRKKRIAAYNMFTTEGKVKATVRGSFKWVKTKISDIRYSV